MQLSAGSGLAMKNELNDESLEIELEVDPSFSPPLKITANKGVIAYQGNLEQENYIIGPNDSGKITISPSDFNDLLEDIKLSRIPASPEFSMGLDGTTYTICIKNGFNSVTYSWWEECPPEWEKLGKLADKLIDYVERDIVKL